MEPQPPHRPAPEAARFGAFQGRSGNTCKTIRLLPTSQGELATLTCRNGHPDPAYQPPVHQGLALSFGNGLAWGQR
jgi:hypothetical protein